MARSRNADVTGRPWVQADKVNSRVTKAHIEQLQEAMAFATDPKEDGYVRLGYLSFAVATILKDVGLPEHYQKLSVKMWANFGKPTEENVLE